MLQLFSVLLVVLVVLSAQADEGEQTQMPGKTIDFNDLIESAKVSQSEAENTYGVKRVDVRGPDEAFSAEPIVIPGETIHATSVIAVGAGARNSKKSLSFESPLVEEVTESIPDNLKVELKPEIPVASDPYPELVAEEDLEEASSDSEVIPSEVVESEALQTEDLLPDLQTAPSSEALTQLTDDSSTK